MRENERHGGERRDTSAPFLLLLSFLAGFSVLSCSFNYEEGGSDSAELPSAIFTDFTHAVYVDGAKLLTLHAAEAETYDSDGRTSLRDVSFVEYDRKTGEPAARGKADAVTFWSETENAEFLGNIRIESLRDEASLSSEFLAWDGHEKLLSSGLDRTVEIRRADGSWVRGAGFSADSRRRSFAFREAVEGSFVIEDQPAETVSPEDVGTDGTTAVDEASR